MRRRSAAVRARLFSQSTCLPAASAAQASAAWDAWSVQIETASTPGSANTSAARVVQRAPGALSAAARARSGSRSQTATTFAAGLCA